MNKANNAVSATGGDYPASFRFKQVGTIPSERNAASLVAGPPAADSGIQISYTRYAWYDNEVKTGIIRGGSVDMLGYSVDINAKRVLTVSPAGDVLPAGYILSKAANYYDDPSSRNLGLSGFLRPNNIHGLDALAIHVAHPGCNGPEYARGISFTYGGGFGISTYAFDKDGKFVGSKRLWTENNAKPDANGFLKQSSPIIEIHPDGTFTTNEESKGAEVTKEGMGIYRISNVCGYNTDMGWGVHGGISVPKDNNNLELIFVDDRVQPDGAIIIETFHRQHSHLPTRFQNWRLKSIDENGERVFYEDGEPCDIPEHCRLDVRVQMPKDSVWNVKQREFQERMEGIKEK